MGKRKNLIGEINELLGTKLEFRRVALKELEELHDAISAKFGGVAGLPIGQNIQGLLDAPLVQVLKKRLANKKLEELTVRDLVSALQKGTGDKGIFGLGIIPKLFGLGKRK